mmetsp:Transcript_46329/g.117311  ORF Transcript_46329/g.117311 Transcript_46329/m.117311 type:complete len:370 (-) Transcript_46329:421-1530(-)|eukprot:jgi/Tetstr1/455784/TSEL_042581.t1
MQPQPKLNVLDGYGFAWAVTQEQQAERVRCDEAVARREAKWDKYAKRRRFPELQKLKRYLRKGVPPRLRKWVWFEISGAARLRDISSSNYYQVLLRTATERPSDFKAQIELDLPRTFPGVQTWLASAEGQAKLGNVLLAYSMHNPQVGYCQSMNYVAALLLLSTGKDEEDTFWLLMAILEGLLYPGTYSNNLEGCHVEMKSLAELLAKKEPALAAHMDKLGCDVNLVATDWFLCLFCTTLPIETAARVWDTLLFEGPKVLYRVALALFKMAAPELLKTDNPGDFLVTMRGIVQTCFDRDTLMTTAFEKVGSMPMDRISKYRREKQLIVDQEMARREAIARTNTMRQTIAEQSAKYQRSGGHSGGSSSRK